jgi:hypothetical protein
MKKKEINIFTEAKIYSPTENDAEKDACHSIQVYLDIIKNDKSKIEVFKNLVNELFYRIQKEN